MQIHPLPAVVDTGALRRDLPASTTRTRVRRPTRADDLGGWLSYADSLHRQSIDMGLERVVRVKHALGLTPTVPIITVAGTNGKGSTCAMLSAILQAAGYRVGVYTSPHLLRYNERVRVDGAPVSDALLCAGFAQVDGARGDVPLTPFEFGTLAAMCVLLESGLDAIVLEVGLGGRLDAVNAFDADCAIVTSIGIDHVEYLGPTRESIGREKAGIFRAGRPAISADVDPPATIAEEADRIGARLLQSGLHYRVRRDGGRHWIARPGQRPIELPRPALEGEAQWHNSAACIMALEALAQRLPTTAEHRRAGLAQARLTGRFQRLRPAGPNGAEVVLDVAHNAHAAQRLARTLQEHPVAGRTLAVFSMLRDKDIEDSVRAIDACVDQWFIGGIDDRRGCASTELAAWLDAAQVRGPVKCSDSIAAAFTQAWTQAEPDDRVLVFGSFSTVAAALREAALIDLAAQDTPGRMGVHPNANHVTGQKPVSS